MKVGDAVQLNPVVANCKFYPILGQMEYMMLLWYQPWWDNHIGKTAHVIWMDKDSTHIQFDGETSKYLISEMYLKAS